ncbi:hypothetical protein BB560_001929 [Smittium megazygosporum]|uniref:Glycosyltransferase family 15 protein n=1 Tax=Smittium megazygosporum TaxID=133381 RepID=A0A2T9ZG71_9FUNG|nr:hypothetical protein BB560_003061 [Smittium megazygosporum]PVV03585.1 hypothetical protein BB560_001929 [Smittium megazygosporum]
MLTKRLLNTLKLLLYVAVFSFCFYSLFVIQNLQVPQRSTPQELENKQAQIFPRKRNMKAALVSLVRNSDLSEMRSTIRELEDRFNYKYGYPYIFLNDVPFTDEFKEGVTVLTKANVSFGILDSESWGYPEWIDQEKAAHIRKTAKYMHAGSESYRFMCRFQSGYVFRHKLLEDLDFYWRIEPEVNYFCDIDYDPFEFMHDNNKIYGWNLAPTELKETIPTLWDVTKQFMREYPNHIPKDNLLKWVTDENGDYNGCHFWSNFEIVNLSFYRSKAYMDYFNYLDKAGGFFYERWGDAPVHTLAVAMFLSKDQVQFFNDIGYFHPAIGFCPEGSDSRGKCVCDPKEHPEMNLECVKRWDLV